MTDLTSFTPLHQALAAAVSATRLRTGQVRTAPAQSLTAGEAAAARRALTELVPYERSIKKMFDGLRAKQLNRYRWAGHQFVAHLVNDYVVHAAAADSRSPAWSLPLTPELVQLVLPGADAPAELVQGLHLKPAHVAALRAMDGSTVRELAEDYRLKVIAMHQSRRAQREAALERAKQVLSAEDLELLVDKTLY